MVIPKQQSDFSVETKASDYEEQGTSRIPYWGNGWYYTCWKSMNRPVGPCELMSEV